MTDAPPTPADPSAARPSTARAGAATRPGDAAAWVAAGPGPSAAVVSPTRPGARAGSPVVAADADTLPADAAATLPDGVTVADISGMPTDTAAPPDPEAAPGVDAKAPLVGIVMGSTSDWPTMKAAADILAALGVAHEARIVSAHRTPDRLWEYGHAAAGRGLRVIVAGAGGAAHLPGMMASKTRLPVIGVPIRTEALSGVDALYSIVQMPRGFPVATMAIGPAGAVNAGLLAAAILALGDPALAARLDRWRADLSASISETPE